MQPKIRRTFEFEFLNFPTLLGSLNLICLKSSFPSIVVNRLPLFECYRNDWYAMQFLMQCVALRLVKRNYITLVVASNTDTLLGFTDRIVARGI